jgi:serine/threonine-protein kinase
VQAGVWKADWFLGVAVVALFALFSSMSELVPSLERTAYDAALQAASRTPSDKVAVIAIDQQSIDNIGRWPWPRDTHARMIDILAQAKARAIGYLVFFAEPENERINRTLVKLMEAAAPGVEGAAPSALLPLLKEAQDQFNTDRKLAASIERAGNVVLPLLFNLEVPRGQPDKALPQFIRRNAVTARCAAKPSWCGTTTKPIRRSRHFLSRAASTSRRRIFAPTPTACASAISSRAATARRACSAPSTRIPASARRSARTRSTTC